MELIESVVASLAELHFKQNTFRWLHKLRKSNLLQGARGGKVMDVERKRKRVRKERRKAEDRQCKKRGKTIGKRQGEQEERE